MHCVEILLDFSLLYCAKYNHFGFLLKASVFLTNCSLIISEKYILKERNKHKASFCCEVIIAKILVILSSTMLLFLWAFFCFLYIYIYIYIYLYLYLYLYIYMYIYIYLYIYIYINLMEKLNGN